MSKTIFIQLTTAGPGTGPFDLYCIDSLGNETGPFETNIPKSQLVSGFISNNACDDIASVKVVSLSSLCDNYIVIDFPTTTTSTSTTSTTTSTTSTTTTTTCAPQSFVMQASGITDVNFTAFSSTAPVSIIWATGVSQTWNPGDSVPSHTYPSAYTGNIVIQSCDLSTIQTLSFGLVANILPSTGTITIKDTELTKLTGLVTCDLLSPRINFINNGGAVTSTQLLPSTLVSFKAGTNNMTGNISNLPTGLTTFYSYGSNTLSGFVSSMPSGIQYFEITGLNTIDGLIGDMPLSTRTFVVFGYNTIHGKLSAIKGATLTPTQSNTNPNLQVVNVLGNNYVHGDLADMNWKKVIVFNLGGVQNQATPETTSFLSGNLDTLPVISVLDGGDGVHKFRTDMRVLGQNFGYSTITGNVNNFPNVSSFYSLQLGGENGSLTDTSYAGNPTLGYPAYPVGGWGIRLSGNIGDVPHVGMITLSLSGRNTITGDVATFLPAIKCDFFQILGNNTIYGDISNLPPIVRTVNIQGQHNVNTYSTSRSWIGGATPPFSGTPYSMCKFVLQSSILANRITNQTQLNTLITDLNVNNLWKNYGSIAAEVKIRSSLTPTGGAVADLATLNAKLLPPNIVSPSGLGATIVT